MPLYALSRRSIRHAAGLILIIQHQIATIEPQPNPTRLISITGTTNDLKAQSIAIKGRDRGILNTCSSGVIFSTLIIDRSFPPNSLANSRRRTFAPYHCPSRSRDLT